MRRTISRRAALVTLAALGGGAVLAGGGYLLVDDEVLPGKSVLNNALGRCDAAVPDPGLRGTPGQITTGAFDSVRRGRKVNFALAYPPGYGPGDALPVCLALHGYSSNGLAAVNCGDYPIYLAGAVRAGAAPFVVAGPDGGDGYWHPHATDDPLGMLLDEFVPLLATRGLKVDKLAVAGWSMGGYGALVCALTRPDRFVAVMATSPAIFHSYQDAHRVNPGAFDSPAEWAAYDVTARAGELRGRPVRIAIGAADPFAPAVRTLRDRLPDPSVVRIDTGCHDNRLWSSVAPDQVRAISRALG